MTAIERKKNTETLLRELGIPFIDHLPTVEEEDEVRLRTPADIAKRLLCLTYLCYAIEDEDSKPKVIEFLKKDGLWESVSDEEKGLFTKSKLTAQERINVSWRSEAIWLLLWAIEKVDELDLPIEEVSINDVVDKMPKFLSSTKVFIESATIRSVGEILDQSDLVYRLHWATRQTTRDNSINLDLNTSIVQERHWAINWMTYSADNWDDITTDT